MRSAPCSNATGASRMRSREDARITSTRQARHRLCGGTGWRASPGDLLDIIQAGGRYATEAEALAAGHSFIEAEAEAQHRLNADLVPHTEALCRRFLPKGVKRDGEWRAAHTLFDASDCSVSVQLSGPARGVWKNATTGEQGGQLLDLVHRTGEHLTITETMEAARALIERQAEAEREAELQREAQAQRVSGQARRLQHRRRALGRGALRALPPARCEARPLACAHQYR